MFEYRIKSLQKYYNVIYENKKVNYKLVNLFIIKEQNYEQISKSHFWTYGGHNNSRNIWDLVGNWY